MPSQKNSMKIDTLLDYVSRFQASVRKAMAEGMAGKTQWPDHVLKERDALARFMERHGVDLDVS